MNWIDVNEQLPPPQEKVIVVVGRRQTMAYYYPAGTLAATEWDDPPFQDDPEWEYNGEQIWNRVPMWHERPPESDTSYRVEGVTHWMQRPPLPEMKRMPVMSCPECHTPELIFKKYSHLYTCSHATADDLRYWMSFYRDYAQQSEERMHSHRTEAQRWEGKFRIMFHENNQLRKQLAKYKERTL